LQIKDDWQAFAAALTPLLTPFGAYAATLNSLIVKLAKVRTTQTLCAALGYDCAAAL
jgi:hypothetical protein